MTLVMAEFTYFNHLFFTCSIVLHKCIILALIILTLQEKNMSILVTKPAPDFTASAVLASGEIVDNFSLSALKGKKIHQQKWQDIIGYSQRRCARYW